MPGTPNTFVPAGTSPLFGDVPVDVIDVVDKPPKRPSDAASEFEINIIQLASESATAVASNLNPLAKVLRIIVLGEKVVKLIFGSDEERGSNTLFGVMDEAFQVPPAVGTDKLRAIVEKVKVQASAAGWTVMEPVWLKDPKVGE